MLLQTFACDSVEVMYVCDQSERISIFMARHYGTITLSTLTRSSCRVASGSSRHTTCILGNVYTLYNVFIKRIERVIVIIRRIM